MSRQRLRAIQRRIDKIVNPTYPASSGQRTREIVELDRLVSEIGTIMLHRLESKPDWTTTEKALYYYLRAKVRR